MLKMMSESSARALRLSVGNPAQMMDSAAAPVDASSHPLTRQEILQLIGPIIPEHARRRLPQETSVEFDHGSPSGAFKVTLLRNGSEIAVSIVPDQAAAPAPPPPVQRLSAPVPEAEPSMPVASTPPPSAAARTTGAPAIDRLFYMM